MRFQPDPPPPDRATASEHPAWRRLLIASAVIVVACAVAPWIRVQFERLFAVSFGPPGWQSSAGFTCLCSGALVVVLTFIETGTASSRAAVRPASLMLAALSLLATGMEWLQGPGTIGGVSAVWTLWFYVLLVSLPLLLVACAQRWAACASPRG